MVIETFLDLVRISSPSKTERDVADYIIQKLTPYQLSIMEDDVATKIGGNCGNIIVTIPGEGEHLLFSAHMDTVSPCEKVEPNIIDGAIYSDGNTILGGDDKAGVAVLLELIIELCESKREHPKLTFIFSVCEEESLQGVKHLDPKYYEDVDFAYILDGEGKPGSVVNQTPHGCKGILRIVGKEAHAGVEPQNGINALYVAAQAIVKLPNGRIDEDTTCNIGVIHGGSSTNVVMGLLEMNFEARSYKLDKLKQLIDKVETTFAEECATYGAHFDSTLTYGTSGYCFSKDDRDFDHLRDVCKVLSLPFQLETCGGASDASIYIANGIKAFNLGVGIQAAHSVKEHIAIVDIQTTYRIVSEMIKKRAIFK